MDKILASNQAINLREEIISQTIWSDTYSSLKHILKRTANQLPLLVSFLDTTDPQQTENDNYQTIFFFDRNLSNKLLFTPLQQREDQSDRFDVYPKHCTFVMTDSFKGLFEFVRNGQRCAQVFPSLGQLITFSSNLKCSVVFMSRDRALGYFQDPSSLQWTSKEYPQGAIFRAERIHHSSLTDVNGQQIPNDYVECHDEDDYSVFIKSDQIGRFSLIATSNEQQVNQPEIYVHSTQTPNIGQLIKSLTMYNNNKNKNNCIRLVRGPVPYNFICQYFQFVRQHTHDVLVGLTQEGLVIEWNLDSHVPCRYATNLNDILDNIYGTSIQQTLESYIDQARRHYRDNFRYDMQLISTGDWTAFFQYWKWNGSIRRKYKDENHIPYQSRHRFHLIASIQDLSDYSRAFISAYRKYHYRSQDSTLLRENKYSENKKALQPKQRSLLSQMSKLISTPRDSKKPQSDRSFQQTSQTSALLLPNGQKPFDDSIYDSNQIHHHLPSPQIRPGTCSKCSILVPNTTRRALSNGIISFPKIQTLVFGSIVGTACNMEILV